MGLKFFLKGAAIGLSIAAPVGPIGVLCIRRSLAEGQWVGLMTGLGAATADAVYGCVAAFGLTAISNFLVGRRAWMALIGGAFLCYLGIKTFFALPPSLGAPTPATGAGAYLSTFFLTLTNPMTILSFVAVFAGFGLAAAPSRLAATMLVSGVFAGSALWWLILSGGVSFLRPLMETGQLALINKLSGAVILAFGVFALTKAARPPAKPAPGVNLNV